MCYILPILAPACCNLAAPLFMPLSAVVPQERSLLPPLAARVPKPCTPLPAANTALDARLFSLGLPVKIRLAMLEKNAFF